MKFDPISPKVFAAIRSAHRQSRGRLTYRDLAQRFKVSNASVCKALHTRPSHNTGQALRRAQSLIYLPREVTWKRHSLNSVINNFGAIVTFVKGNPDQFLKDWREARRAARKSEKTHETDADVFASEGATI